MGTVAKRLAGRPAATAECHAGYLLVFGEFDRFAVGAGDRKVSPDDGRSVVDDFDFEFAVFGLVHGMESFPRKSANYMPDGSWMDLFAESRFEVRTVAERLVVG